MYGFSTLLYFDLTFYTLSLFLEMMRFLVDRTNIDNVNVVQPEAEVEEPPPNVANGFNPNEIVRDLGLRKQIHLYVPDIQDDVSVETKSLLNVLRITNIFKIIHIVITNDFCDNCFI